MDFCTLGMFIIDDIYPAKTDTVQEPYLDVVGGAGTYSAVGARLFSPPPSTAAVGWVVDTGTDFPESVRQTIASWQTDVLLRPRAGLTTRGWNGYGENDFRSFKYLTEKIRITDRDLTDRQVRSKTFHLICSGSRCIDLVNGINARRAGHSKPLYIWEPVPDLCIPEERERILEALKYIDVFSPNHDELAALFETTYGGDDQQTIEANAKILLDHGIGSGGNGAVVVRCGKTGCRTYTRHHSEHIGAYHTDQSKVVDPTGGGNGFLGGFGVGLARTRDVFEAASWGSIAASFCIEQVGPPLLSSAGEELWNGESVVQRLSEFKQRPKE